MKQHEIATPFSDILMTPTQNKYHSKISECRKSNSKSIELVTTPNYSKDFDMNNKNQFELKCSGENFQSKDNCNLRNFRNYNIAKLTSPEEEKKESNERKSDMKAIETQAIPSNSLSLSYEDKYIQIYQLWEAKN